MGYCRICGEVDELDFTCNFCNRRHCERHRLPEKHDCSGLERADVPERIETRDGGAVGAGPASPEPEPARGEDDDLLGRHLSDRSYRFLESVGGLVESVFRFSLGALILSLQFLLSRRGVYAIAIAALSVAVVSAVIGTGIDPVDDTVNGAVVGVQEAVDDVGQGALDETATPPTTASTPTDSSADSGGQAAGTSAADGSTTDTTPASDTTLDVQRIESDVHRFVNEERTDRGRSSVAFDDSLAEVARSHSQDMATNDYFSHTSPDGADFSDRYDRHGYDCRVSTGGNRYATGGENIAYTYADTDVRRDDGTVVDHDDNETSIARGLVTGWMNSEGHRENVLREYWENEGIGVATREMDDGTVRVYATQNFC